MDDLPHDAASIAWLRMDSNQALLKTTWAAHLLDEKIGVLREEHIQATLKSSEMQALGKQIALSNTPWTLATINPRMMWIDNGVFLISLSSLGGDSPERKLTIERPLLIHRPDFNEDEQMDEPRLGRVFKMEGNVNFAMVGSSGDQIHQTNRDNSWEEIDAVWYASLPQQFPPEYIMAGVAMSVHIAIENDELDIADLPVAEFIPTYQDKRKPILIDKTMGGPAVWHDEIRCSVCNGRVLLKLPRGNTLSECKCPHSLASFKKRNHHDIHFPHLVDDRIIEEGGDSLANVPKEAQ